MSETTIINGQPQGLSNKMVTYDGLVDFLKMLKNEIPRMGYKNSLSGSFAYAFGNSNTCQGAYSLLIGESNYGYKQNNFLLGIGNKINIQQGFCCGRFNEIWAKDQGSSVGAYIMGIQNTLGTEGEENSLEQIRSVYILGSHNSIKQEQKSLAHAYGFGHDLTLTSNSVWLGSYNDPKSDVVFGIGNGAEGQLRNLFEITNDGAIRLGTASISQSGLTMPDGIITLGTTSISESELAMPGGTISAVEIGSTKMIADEFFAEDSLKKSWIKIENIEIHHTANSADDEDGVALENKSFYSEFQKDTINDQDEPVLLNGGLRPVFRPWRKNEMLWVTSIHNDDNKDVLHINYIDKDTLKDSYNPHWYIPSIIHFHAGGGTTWATLKCNKVIVTGNIHGTAEFSEPADNGRCTASWQLYSSGLYSLQLIENETTLKESGIVYIDVTQNFSITIGEVTVTFDNIDKMMTAAFTKGADSSTLFITAIQYAQLTVEGEEIQKE